MLPSLGRGSHLITPFIQSSLKKEFDGIQYGLLHLFVQHTSCALSLNENWDEDVRKDMSDALDKIVVEDKVRNLLYFPRFPCFFFAPPSGERQELGGGFGRITVHSATRFLFDISRTENQMPPKVYLTKFLSLTQGGKKRGKNVCAERRITR